MYSAAAGRQLEVLPRAAQSSPRDCRRTDTAAAANGGRSGKDYLGLPGKESMAFIDSVNSTGEGWDEECGQELRLIVAKMSLVVSAP